VAFIQRGTTAKTEKVSNTQIHRQIKVITSWCPSYSDQCTQSGGQSQIQDDDDLAVTEDEVTYTDPWSRALITDESVTNRKCKHTYDKKTAMRMIDNSIKNKKPVKCPVVGCSNKDPILKAHLFTDPEVQKKVVKQRKR